MANIVYKSVYREIIYTMRLSNKSAFNLMRESDLAIACNKISDEKSILKV